MTEKDKPAVKYRYKGPGQFLNVPAADITAEEFDRMPADYRRIVLHSGAYEEVKEAKEKASSTTKAAADNKDGGA